MAVKEPTIEQQLHAERKCREALVALHCAIDKVLIEFDPRNALETAHKYSTLVGQAEAHVTLAFGAWTRIAGR